MTAVRIRREECEMTPMTLDSQTIGERNVPLGNAAADRTLREGVEASGARQSEGERPRNPSSRVLWHANRGHHHPARV